MLDTSPEMRAHPIDEGQRAPALRSLWGEAARRLARNRAALVGLALVLLFVVAGLFAPLLARYPPAEQHVADGFAPAFQHRYWLGADQLGRDEYSRILYGLRLSLEVGVAVQVIVLVVGVGVGGAAGLGGPGADNLLMRVTDIFYAFPDLLLVILLQEAFGSGQLQIFLAIGLVAWVTVARLVRGQILSLKQRDFVLAARALGASPFRIALWHLLPNAISPVIVAITFGIPAAIFTEATLAFIGFGLPPPSASLGTLASEGQQAIFAAPTLVIFPVVAIALIMFAFTFLGDGLRDALDPSTR
jgi:oligopeptide transport system permease protein